MIWPALQALAPINAASPTPPKPNTATLWPGRTLAVFIAAPVPVMTAQPNSVAYSKGKVESIFTSEPGRAMVYCE